MVSLSDSPLSTLEPEPLRLMVSADRRLAASSKEDDVRVELSKKTFTTVRPRSVGTFFTSRASTLSKPRRGVQDALDVLALAGRRRRSGGACSCLALARLRR